MFCTKCGAPLREGVQFCTACGARVSSMPGQPPPSPAPRADKTGWRTWIAAAALAAVTLAAALGAFAWVSAPKPDTPSGALALLVDGLARGDGSRVARVLDLSLGTQARLEYLAAEEGQAMLRSLLQLPGEEDSPQAMQTARLITAAVTYTNPDGTACRADALVRLTWADGTQTTAQLPDVTMEYGGSGWHIVSGLGPTI